MNLYVYTEGRDTFFHRNINLHDCKRSEVTDISVGPQTSQGVEYVVAGVSAGWTEGGGRGPRAVARSASGALTAGEIQPGAQTESFVEQTGLASRSQTCKIDVICKKRRSHCHTLKGEMVCQDP